jgi:hypothetical protein
MYGLHQSKGKTEGNQLPVKEIKSPDDLFDFDEQAPQTSSFLKKSPTTETDVRPRLQLNVYVIP